MRPRDALRLLTTTAWLLGACQAGEVEPPVADEEPAGEEVAAEEPAAGDGAQDAGEEPDGAPEPDADTGPDAGPDEGPDLDPCRGHCGNGQQDCGEAGVDCGGECGACPDPTYPRMLFTPSSPAAGQHVDIDVQDTDDHGWTYIDLAGTGPCGAFSLPLSGDVYHDTQAHTYTWHFEASLTGGSYGFTFTADHGATEVVSAGLQVGGATSCDPCEGHCANGRQDCGETGSDCGGECPACPAYSFVGVSGGQFVRDGTPLRFVGVTLRGVTHYGCGDALPWAPSGDRDLGLAQASAMRARVIRAFVAYQGISPEAAADRLQATLDELQPLGLTLIAALTDFYATPFHPQGDDGAYALDLNGYTVLSHAWFAGGYQTHYRPFVEVLVNRLSDHPALFAWELGNEIKDATFADSSAGTFIAFCHDMADFIRARDPNHLIAVGEISVANSGLTEAQGRTLFTHPDLAFLTVRSYYPDRSGAADIGLAQSLGRPIIVEEAGCRTSDGDRPTLLRADLATWFDAGVAGYIQWGFMPGGSDNGDGDWDFGMDHVFHADYDGLFDAYRDRAQTLGE